MTRSVKILILDIPEVASNYNFDTFETVISEKVATKKQVHD
jgi:hypothetical protein